jgi:hypothetical protein
LVEEVYVSGCGFVDGVLVGFIGAHLRVEWQSEFRVPFVAIRPMLWVGLDWPLAPLFPLGMAFS